METPFSFVIKAVAVAGCYSLALSLSFLMPVWLTMWNLETPFTDSGAFIWWLAFVVFCLPVVCFLANQYFLRLLVNRSFLRMLLAGTLVVLQLSAFLGFLWLTTDEGTINVGSLDNSLYGFYRIVFIAALASFVTVVIPPLLMVVVRFKPRLS
jgi:hypothetical protein